MKGAVKLRRKLTFCSAMFPSMNEERTKHFLPWVVATALFMEQMDSTIINTAVPAMAASLHVAPLSLKAVVASYILSLAVCIPFSGWMADRFGTRRVFSTAILIFTLSSVLCGLSVNAPMMIAMRILQGIGAAMMVPVGRLTIIRTFPKSELLHAMNFVIIPESSIVHCVDASAFASASQRCIGNSGVPIIKANNISRKIMLCICVGIWFVAVSMYCISSECCGM